MKSVREGYKITELGEIPKEWEIKRLGEVADSGDKYSFAGGPFGSDLKSEHYTETGIRVIQLQNIGDGYFNNQCKIYTSNEKADELIKCNVYPDDLIIAKMAEPVARACKIPNFEERYLMCSDGIRLKVDDKNDSIYILYAINGEYFRRSAIANSTGTTRLRIGLGELKSLKIAIPPKSEQEKIASILSTVDEQIDNVEKLIEKNKELKKGLMQKLLTKGIGHSKFKKTEIGEIPEEWEVKKLGEVAEFSQGIQIALEEQYEEYKSGYERFLRIVDYTQKSEEYRYIECSIGRYLVECNDIVMVRYGASAGFTGRGLQGVIANNMFKITPDRNILIREFLYEYLNQNNIYKILNRSTGASAMPAINFGIVSRLSIAIPEIDEQKKIASMLYEYEEVINKYKNKKIQLEELKKGLLQQLLTGKIRIE